MIVRGWKILWPVFLSAISFFITFLIIQPIALTLDPSFSLYASRGIGKIGLTVLVILQLLLLIFSHPSFFHLFIKTNISFLATPTWLKKFFTYFILFFGLHLFFLIACIPGNYAYYNNAVWTAITPQIIGSLLWGFIATFFLAWTEELIFRGTIYQFFAQAIRPITSALITSFIFMLVHDLHNPLTLLTTHWHLGIGLFLLGLFLNLIFIITKKLYTGMGIHAGLVFVKVIMRRIPFLTFSPQATCSLWFTQDLRQSLLIHLVFCAVITVIIFRYRKILFKTNQ